MNEPGHDSTYIVAKTNHEVTLDELRKKLTDVLTIPPIEAIWREALKEWPKPDDEIEVIVGHMKEPKGFQYIDKAILWYLRGYVAGVRRDGLGIHPTETHL